MRVLVTGATGLVGSALCPALRSAGHSVRTLSRNTSSGPDSFSWDPEAGVLPADALTGCDAVVHLAGENIADGRWTRSKKLRIRRSRVESTALLSRAVAATPSGPRTLISASAIGIYGERGSEWLNEDSSSGSGFLADVCREWESAARPAVDAGIRCVFLRLGVVLSSRGGALGRMLPAFRWGAGGVLGSGEQHLSWIAMSDLTRVVQFALESESLRGPVNAVSPSPVTNREFTEILAWLLGRPAFLPIPACLLRLAFGEMADATLLASARVEPTRLKDQGFVFLAPTLPQALRLALDQRKQLFALGERGR